MALRRYFEWIDGEDSGEVVILDSIEIIDGETFYHFDNGESCNLRFISKMTNNRADLKGKFMVEISSPSNPWTTETIQPKKYIDESMKGQDIEIPTLHDMLKANGSVTNLTDSDVGKTRLIPPKMPQGQLPLPSPEEYPMKKVEPKVVQQKPVVEPILEPVQETHDVQGPNPQPGKNPDSRVYNPIHILVDSCKKVDTDVSLDLNIKLPSRHIYQIAANEFENGVEEFIDYVVSNIDTNVIVNELKIALIQAYQSVEPPAVVNGGEEHE